MKKIVSLALAFLMVSSLVFASGAEEQKPVSSYPNKTIQMIVPYGAGGGADISVRLLTKYLEQELGQKFIVQNVSGGSGTIGFTQLANAKADGYTLGYFSSTQTNDALLFEGIKYDNTSFTPISLFSNDPHIVVVSKASGITNMKQLIEAAKKNPAGMTFGLGGAWTSHDFLRMSLEEKAGVTFKRMVFQSGAAAITAVAGGNCTVAVPFVSEALAQIEAGNVVPIAISSATRFELTPSIPTIKESGYDFEHTMWRALVGPAGLSADVVATIDVAMAKVLSNPQYLAEALNAGTFAEYMNNADFSKYYEENHKFYQKLIMDSNLSK
ncbi:tripartite tricarboxylate transporter substrate binding protein [Sphaerochaeta sp. PS]|uniref:tripartite tricarboxylate transporter substrate binding protein n=1 Tax=Sphaerochaeta sp. PS TaxID=3076336 RepID=UPI0028A47161|nr:tripartite tricarboxylate transporter substrate binding protein [Sphaerochaeta sp. PS]MDT4762991.1 tripartite tricarboxylate transporter substrate binding protein [Sphaerochaeta sp. PS]